MAFLLGALHLLTAAGYIFTLGVLGLRDLWTQHIHGEKLSLFGMALVAMAFTCGPHHFEHGLHMMEGNAGVGRLDLAGILIGFIPASIFVLLRFEALFGGKGDRRLYDTPTWLVMVPWLVLAWAAGMAAAGAVIFPGIAPAAWWAVPQGLLVILYSLIGWWLIDTQRARWLHTGTWSILGLSLGLIFPTCALSHAAYGYDLLTGAYPGEVWHTGIIDGAGVVAAAWFCYVVWNLRRKAHWRALHV